MTLKSKFMHSTNIGIFLGIVILSIVLVSFHQIQIYQEEIIKSNKNSIKDAVINTIDRRESRIETIAYSIIALVEGSESLTANEFSIFNKKILETNPEIINVLLLENDIIIHSYRDQNTVGKNFDSVYPDFPIKIDEVEVLSAEFFIDSKRSVLILIPYNYFLNVYDILTDDYKIIIENPIKEGILFEFEKINGKIKNENIIFSNDELNNSIQINKNTEIFGHKIEQKYILKSRIWDNSFSNEIGVEETTILGFGILIAIIVPIQTTRSIKLSKKLKIKSSQLEVSNKQLIKSKKEKDEFIAMMSHELKTPLTAITVWVDALRQPGMLGKLNPEQEEALEEISTGASHLTQMINNFFDIFKLDLGKLTIVKNEINVNDLMEKIQKTYEVRCKEKGISLVNSTTEKIIMENDEKRIRQILGNLIINAIDFVPQNTGKIEISAKQNEEGNVIFFVKDNGKGIDKDKQNNLFHKFYQVDTSSTREHGGTGLGLSICKGLVEAMGGKIWVESELGKGAIFYFMIPKVLSKIVDMPFNFKK